MICMYCMSPKKAYTFVWIQQWKFCFHRRLYTFLISTHLICVQTTEKELGLKSGHTLSCLNWNCTGFAWSSMFFIIASIHESSPVFVDFVHPVLWSAIIDCSSSSMVCYVNKFREHIQGSGRLSQIYQFIKKGYGEELYVNSVLKH